MNNEMKDKPEKGKFFPSIGGFLSGLIPGIFALFNEVSQPFWVTFNLILIVVAFGFAGANLIGLAVIKYRGSSKRDKTNP